MFDQLGFEETLNIVLIKMQNHKPGLHLLIKMDKINDPLVNSTQNIHNFHKSF
jgi:hypothetical protein